MPGKYVSMREVTLEDYREFVKTHKEVVIGNARIRIGYPKRIKEFQPKDFKLETTNVWSFPERGSWATHRGDFRGNWPPQLVRNIIIRYSRPGELVLDQMCGSGTTLVECKLLGRNAIGVDINPDCIMLTLDRLNFEYNPLDPSYPRVTIRTYVGDARNLDLIEDESVDLIATHPPYVNIIPYSRRSGIPGDISTVGSLEEYVEAMREVARESYRVLKPGRYCAILVGDIRRNRHHVPVAFRVMQAFLEAGFILKEDVVKLQWNMRTTRERWEGLARTAEECWVDADRRGGKRYTDFYLLAYEHLFVFRKPRRGEDVSPYRDSMRWW